MASVADVTIEDNSKKILEEFEKQMLLGLAAIGVEAQRYAAENCPVDTGRLRNSITWITHDSQGSANGYGKEPAQAEDYAPKGKPDKTELFIGTNVEYAEAVEYRSITHKTGRAHFLRDAATTHGDQYKSIMETALK